MNPGGFGTFGSPSGFNTSSGLFSSSNTTNQNTLRPGGLFGSTTTTTVPALSAPTQSTGLFSTASPFSFASNSSSSSSGVQGSTTGTGIIKFNAPPGTDQITKSGVTTTINTLHQCITAMKEYEGKSLEELRLEDYQGNRKFPSSSTGSFGGAVFTVPGTAGGFGTQTNTLFGSTSNTTNKPLMFGSSTSTTTTSTTGGSIFGSTPQNQANRPFFGGNNNPTTGNTFSGFGSQPTTTNAFGSASTQPSIFGGLASTGPTSGGIFGSNTSNTTSTGGLFSATSSKPVFTGFGPGATTTTAQQPFNFGQTTNPSTTSSTPSIFGQPANSTSSPLANRGTFGGFGSQPTTTTATTTGFSATTTGTTQSSLFGTTPNRNSFGAGLSTGNATTNSFSGFGPSTTTTATPQTNIFGGFGQSTTQPTTATTTTTASPFGSGLSTSGGLGANSFGTGTTSGGLFGSATSTTNSSSTSGLFGNQPNNTSIQPVSGFGSGFGQPTSGQPSLFNTNTATTTTPIAGGLFGPTSSSQSTSQFGISTGASTNIGGLGALSSLSLPGTTSTQPSSFGLNISTQLQPNAVSLQSTQQSQLLQLQQTHQQQQIQQQQILSLSNSPYGSSTSSLLKNTLQDLSKREDILKPLSPIAQRQYISEATSPSKVTTIAAPVSACSSLTSEFKGGLSQPLKITPKVLTTISMNRSSSGNLAPGSGGLFEGLEEEETPCFYPRRNVKKLLFRPSNEHNSGRRVSANGSINGDTHKKTSYPNNDESLKLSSNFSGNAGLNANLHVCSTSNPGAFGSSFMSNPNLITQDILDDGTGHQAADNQSEISTSSSSVVGQHPAGVILERPGYFTIPSMQDLASIYDPKTGDCLVENFSIGRVDYGCITFPGLTNVSGINLDEIVHIRRKEVHVYPDDSRKPSVGQGLNKAAEITLHRIWPLDKQTKIPITDPNRVIEMGYNKKIERATIEMGATFIDYDPVTGSWTFKVKHFSKYGLNDSDDDSDEINLNLNRMNPSNLNQLGSATGFFNSERNKNLDSPSSKTLVGQNISNKDTSRHEKDMIEQQLKLIETRRMELMQQNRKGSIGVGHNTITHNKWDQLINEYNIAPSGKLICSSKMALSERTHIHLELSSEESELAESDDLDENESLIASRANQIRKALVLDNDADETVTDLNDENKENKSELYPSLSEIRNKIKNNDRLYPNLNDIITNYPDGLNKPRNLKDLAMNLDDEKESIQIIRDNELEGHFQEKGDLMTFLSNKDQMYGKNLREDRKFTEIFFSEDDNMLNLNHSNPKNESEQAKYSGFNQKSITMGLLKRGLGVISMLNSENKLTTGETAGFSSSIKGDQFHGEAKVAKFSAYNLALVNSQKISGPVIIKPKLWNRFLIVSSLKSKKSSKNTADAVAKSGYIKLNDSISKNLYSCVLDGGFFNSRRFRPSWTLNPVVGNGFTRLHLSSSMQSFAEAVQILTVHLSPSPERVETIRHNCELYLDAQLELSEFYTSKIILPVVRPKKGNQLIRRCFQITQLIRNNIGDHPDADNVNHMKMVWGLCEYLWGDIPESLRPTQKPVSNMSAYEIEQIRKRSLGEWLSEVSSQRVEKECKYMKFNKCKDSYLGSIFSLLTANKVLEACNLAIENMDFRLALLISQSSGGNELVRTMIRKQLKEWTNSDANKFISSERLKVYVLIAGDLEYNLKSNSQSHLINICENLDWKRQFAINLWYQSLPINSINDALIEYEKCVENEISNPPVPPYVEDSIIGAQLDEKKNNLSQNRDIHFDTCYHLIKLYCNSTYSFENVISPLSHTETQLDYRLSWHLAMALLSVQYTQIQKSCLDSIHDSFSQQLQSLGLWHWAVFVLMHIEDDFRRESSLKKVIEKNVNSQSDLDERENFLVDKLRVPAEWIFEKKALRAKYENSHENQLKLLLKAHKWNEAHTLLIDQIAPDLFLKQNFNTLHDYLTKLNKEKETINKWNIGGQIYLDYIRLNQQANILFNFSNDDEKFLNDEVYNEIHNQIMNLSAKIKEFEAKTPNKLLCSIQMAKLLLKFFISFYDINKNARNYNSCSDSEAEEEDASRSSHEYKKEKILSRSVIEKANHQIELIPDQNLFTMMLLKKTQYTRETLIPKGRI